MTDGKDLETGADTAVIAIWEAMRAITGRLPVVSRQGDEWELNVVGAVAVVVADEAAGGDTLAPIIGCGATIEEAVADAWEGLTCVGGDNYIFAQRRPMRYVSGLGFIPVTIPRAAKEVEDDSE